MKKLNWMAAIIMMITAAAGTAVAADIANVSGQSCGSLSGMWHFVNNQTGGAAAGTMTAMWSSGDSCTVGPSKVRRNVQHFNCVASGELISASTNLPGRLVLSDFACSKEPPKEPPPK